MEWISYGLLIVILLYLIGMFGTILWRKFKKTQEQTDDMQSTETPTTMVVVGATVQSKQASQEDQPVYTVVFVTDDGQQKSVQVAQEVFAALAEGDSGALALQNDNYYDFQVAAAVQNQE